jgi:hypothetical protein
LLNQSKFDPLKLGKYPVVKVHFEFPPQPPDLKRFIILNHYTSGKHPYCKCLKATSKTKLYETTPEKLASCVLYQANELQFFNKKTAIQPDESFNISYEHFVRYSKLNKFFYVGNMPDDFHARLVLAIKNSCLLSGKQANELLTAIGEHS